MELDQESKNWRLIRQKLFSAPEPKTSEFFVSQVMERIRTIEEKPRMVFAPARWFAPVVGVAAMLLLTIVPSQEPLSAEALFMGGETDTPSGLAFSDVTEKPDDILALVLEGR